MSSEVGSRVLRVALFGGPRLEYGGEPFTLRASSSAISLLAFLLLHREAPLARRFVAFTLWPDESEATALSRARRALFTLNEALPAAPSTPWIVTDKRSLQWNPQAQVWLDVAEFERLITDPHAAEAAVELYGGPLLPQLADEWVVATRERLASLYSDTLLTLVLRAEARGALRSALRYAQRLLLADPLREDAVRATMSLRLRSGDRAGALQTYREFEARAAGELAAEPMAQTRALFEEITAWREAGGSDTKTNLPSTGTSFVGRDQDVATIRNLLREDTRLLTIMGPGGVGKSRLAIETAWAALPEFADGAWLVQLAHLDDPRLIVNEIAHVFGAEGTTPDTIEDELLRILRPQRLLIILDNCEHLVGPVAALIDSMLQRCPGVRVLATSRERLRLEQEWSYPLGTLDVPQHVVHSVSDAMTYSAVALFVARARAVDGGRFALSDASLHDVVTIVRRTEGIPLAIELAVPWLRVLDVQQLAARLEDRFALLVGSNRTTPRRHETLEAVIAWSVESLSMDERDLFTRTLVFPGTFTFAALAAVYGDEISEIQLMEHLAALVGKSLVTPVSTQPQRFVLLDSVREFGLRREQSIDLAKLRDRHAKHYLAMMEAVQKTRWSVPEDRWVAAIRDDHHNLHAALSWTLEAAGDPVIGARLTVAMSPFYEYASFVAARYWYTRALERLDPDEVALRAEVALQREAFSPFLPYTDERVAELEEIVRIKRASDSTLGVSCALGRLARALAAMGHRDEAGAAIREAVTLARELGDRRHLAWVLRMYALVLSPTDRAERLSLLQESVALLAHERDSSAARALEVLGETQCAAGDFTAARWSSSEALRIYQQFPALHKRAQAACLTTLSICALFSGDVEEGQTAADQALTVALEVGSHSRIGGAVLCVAFVASLAGNGGDGARLVGFADAIARSTLTEPEAVCRERMMAALSRDLHDDELTRLLREGARWTLEEGVAAARLLLRAGLQSSDASA